MNALDILAQRCHDQARVKGFWEGTRNKAEMMMLEVSEIAERLEAVRAKTRPMSEKILDFTLEEEELADLIIRAFDYAGGHGLRLGEAFEAKMNYNSSRPHMHGKRF